MAFKAGLKIILHADSLRASPEKAKKKQRVSSKDHDAELLENSMVQAQKERVEHAKREEDAKRKRDADIEEAKKRLLENEARIRMQKREEAALATFKTLEKAFGSERDTQIMMRSLSQEREMPREKLDMKWKQVCTHFHSSLKEKSKMTTEEIGLDPVEFYKKILKDHIGNLFMRHISVLKSRGVFDRYNPVTKPICLVSTQKKVETDILPNLDAMIPMKHLVDYGLIFADMLSYNPLSELAAYKDLRPLCYGVFHSFHYSFNLAAAFFLGTDGVLGYRFACYNRFEHIEPNPIGPT